jgi:gluconolactonase
MKSMRVAGIAMGVLGAATAVLSQVPAPALRSGPGVQAPQDAREPDLLKTCKVPPPAAGGPGPGGAAPGRGGPPAQAGSRDYTVTEIPGVIAAGQQWKKIWQTEGNNADGMLGTKDGGLLIAQNDNSDVLKLDENGKPSIAYSDTNTGGALSMNTHGVLFLVSRGMNEAIVELKPRRRIFANRYNGDPLDCSGLALNDLVADSKGGVYFTLGALYYADPQGVVTKYGDTLRTNGIMLSPDEKTIYVTNGGTLVAFDIQKDGSLTGQRDFAKLEAGGNGDGSAIDAAGRIYVSSNPGVQVIGPDGKYLGLIPTPRGISSLAFSGADKKTLYANSFIREGSPVKLRDELYAIRTIAQGYHGRAK